MKFGIVAHDEMKPEIVKWVSAHQIELENIELFATGSTGKRLRDKCPILNIKLLRSGPLGGDQQLGAMICEGQLSALIFFIDPLSPHPHDVDIKALIRLATLYDVPHACNRSSADLIINSINQLPAPKTEPCSRPAQPVSSSSSM